MALVVDQLEENASDEDEEIDERESIAAPSTSGENEQFEDVEQLSDRLDIDKVLEDELKRLNVNSFSSFLK